MKKIVFALAIVLTLFQTACAEVVVGYAAGRVIHDSLGMSDEVPDFLKGVPAGRSCHKTEECGKDYHCFLIQGHAEGACTKNAAPVATVAGK
jgi:hypothetical protein